MARIRTIKPEFCTSRDTGALSRDARLFFLQLLTEADDSGRLQWIPRRLAGVLYPHDEDVTPALLRTWAAECAARGMLQLYSVAGSDYVVICNWSKHQKVDHAAKSRIPQPPESLAPDSPILATPSRESRESLAPDLGTGNREQGTGIGSLRSPSSKTGEPVPDPKPPADLNARKAERLRQVTEDAVETFNAVLGKPHGLLPAIRLKVGRKVREREIVRVVQLAREICAEVYGSTVISRQFWADYWALVDGDDFRSGRQAPGRGHENWTPCFEYLTRPRTMLEVFDRTAGETEPAEATAGSAAA